MHEPHPGALDHAAAHLARRGITVQGRVTSGADTIIVGSEGTRLIIAVVRVAPQGEPRAPAPRAVRVDALRVVVDDRGELALLDHVEGAVQSAKRL